MTSLEEQELRLDERRLEIIERAVEHARDGAEVPHELLAELAIVKAQIGALSTVLHELESEARQ